MSNARDVLFRTLADPTRGELQRERLVVHALGKAAAQVSTHLHGRANDGVGSRISKAHLRVALVP